MKTVQKWYLFFILLLPQHCFCSEGDYNSWDFDVKQYTKSELVRKVHEMFHETSLINTFELSSENLLVFIENISKTYRENPYHNFYHAVEVFQFIYQFERLGVLKELLTPVERLSLLISAIGHDAGHPGTNNAFQREFQTEYYQKFGGSSVLEKYHSELTLDSLHSSRVLENLPEHIQVRIERHVLANILTTDVEEHQKFFKMIENANCSNGICCLLLKSADLGHLIRPFEISQKWVRLLFYEMLLQKEEEEGNGVDHGITKQEYRLKLLSGQNFFLEYIAKPLFMQLQLHFPGDVFPFERLENKLPSS